MVEQCGATLGGSTQEPPFECVPTMPMFCAMKKEMRDRVDGAGDVDFMADFADDGVLGGDWDKVLN